VVLNGITASQFESMVGIYPARDKRVLVGAETTPASSGSSSIIFPASGIGTPTFPL